MLWGCGLGLSCAAPGSGAPRVAFAEALSQTDDTRPLGTELATFGELGRSARATGPKGAHMPSAQTAAWSALLSHIDDRLREPPGLDLAQVRLRLQAEVDLDQAFWGDVDPSLAEHLVRTLAALHRALASLSHPSSRPLSPRSFLWPTSPVVINSPWGERTHPIHGDLRFHAGVDLAGERGQEVRAAASGTVLFAGWNGAHGKQLEVQHDAHLTTRYSHLMTLLVDPGQHVKRGEVIALVGQTGQATGPHLHFELRRDGEAVDPEAELPPPPETP